MGAIPECFRINTGVTPYNPRGKEGPAMNLLLGGARCEKSQIEPPRLSSVLWTLYAMLLSP